MKITTNFTPYPAQEIVLDGIIDTPTKHHVIVSGRQAGKSLMILNLSFKFTLETPNSVTMTVSPTFAQSKKLYLEMVKALGDAGAQLIKSNNSQDLIINFKNGSTMHFMSGESYDNLRGYTLDYLFIDETSFQRPDLWNEILKPMMLVKGKKVCFFSTPRGKNHFKDLYDLGVDPLMNDWVSYRIQTKDNPYIPTEEIEAARRLLPRDVFLSEYEGVFTDSSSGVFEDVTAISTLSKYPQQPKSGVKYYGGLDLAISDDYTVLIIMDNEGNIVDWFRERQTSWEQIIGRVSEKIAEWNASVYVELNNIGSVVFEQLRKLNGSKVRSFTTTNKSKNDIIENLKLKMTEGKIHLPTREIWPDLHYELGTFGYKILPSGVLSYSGKIGGGKDDIVMSLAMTTKMLTDNVGKRRFAVPSSR